MGSSSPISKEIHYRIRTDTGTVDGTPTWAANEDTPASVTVGTAFRVRISVQNTGTASDTVTTLGNIGGGGNGIARCGYLAAVFSGWANVFNGADASSDADATNVTTQRLTSGAGSWATATAGYDENESLSVTLANGTFTELETGVVLTGGTSTIGVGGGESWIVGYDGLSTNPGDVVATFTTPDTNGSDFSHGNQLGGAGQQVASQATISMTTAADIRANYLCVVAVSCDNRGTTDTDDSAISGVTIGGIAATKAIQFCNGNAAALAGVSTSIWWLQHNSQINSGSTITATFTDATDSATIQAREYIVNGGKTVAVEATNTLATDAGNPGSIDATTANIECLRIAAHGCEGAEVLANAKNNVRASNSTWSLWWTSGAIMRASSNGTSTNFTGSIVEGKISTGTGAAAQAGALSTTRDWAQVYVAFRADAAGAGQPTVKRAGGVTFMHSLGGIAQNIKIWFEGLWPRKMETANG